MQFFSGKSILVTGGAGFVGSNLCRELVKQNPKNIVCLDNYSTGSPSNHVSSVTYVKGNTKDVFSLIDNDVDICFHLGEYSRVEKSFDDFSAVWDSNKHGTFQVLEFCRVHGIKLVYAGSSTKFGDGGLSRDATPYGWTKASNTELIKNYRNWFDLNYATAYFYNVFGSNEMRVGDYATLIGIFSEKMRINEPLTVVSPGTQVRNFTHVDDIIRGLLLIAEHGEGDDFGIGNSRSWSILQVAELFGGEIKMLPERRGNRHNAELKTEKTKGLGWTAQIDLEPYVEKLRKNNWC